MSTSKKLTPEPSSGVVPREELERRIALLRDRVARVIDERDRLRAERDDGRTSLLGLRERVRATAASKVTTASKGATPVASASASRPMGLSTRLARGQSLPEACVGQVRMQLADRARVEARAFSHALMDDEVTAEVGALCSAIYAHADGFPRLALGLFAKVRPEWVYRWAPVEALDAQLSEDLSSGADQVRTWLAALPEALNAETAGQVHLVSQRLIAHRQFELAQQCVDRLAPSKVLLDSEAATRADWLAAQLLRRAQATQQAVQPAEKVPGKIRFGIIDYKMLDFDRASSNIGDHVQTLASLSNVVRFSKLKFTSNEPGLAAWVQNLRQRLRPEYRLEGPSTEVELTLVDRDFSQGRHYEAPTWMLAFGWYMHPNYRDFFDFPFAPNLRPIFISFHVNNRAMLTPDAVAYLRDNGPIGCRDWSTVYLLREHGIEAFFSGCMTTTVGKVFPKPETAMRDRGVALVDYRPLPNEFAGRPVSKFAQAAVDVRHRPFCSNMDDAVQLLETYRSYQTIATSRLHCYLPSTALGLDVVFKPRSMSDIRFEGLVELGDRGFATIRDGIEQKLAQVLERIFSGASEQDVRQLWRELCREDMAYADAYCQRDIDLGVASFDPAQLAAQVREQALHGGKAAASGDVQVAFAVDHNLSEELPVVLESALANAKVPLHFHVMTRGLDRTYWERLLTEFGAMARLSFYNFDVVDYGEQLRMLAHTTVSTMDRLMLPDLLPDLGKIIYLDVDILVLGDLGELWQVALGDAPIAGKSSTFSSWRYGYNMVYRAAGSLPHQQAWQLRRAMHARGPLVFSAFNAGVVVMNLERLRRDDFARHYVPLIERYGMNDQDALNVYARQERVVLGVEWNAVPSQDITDNAKILHFAGPVKPWSSLTITRGREFKAYRNRYLQRVGSALAD